MRCDEWLDIILHLDVSDNVRRAMGIALSSAEESIKLSMVGSYTKLLERAFQIPKTWKGNRVVSRGFDSSISTSMVPHYLLTGLVITLPHTAFRKVSIANGRMHLQHQIIVVSTDNGSDTNGRFLYHETSSLKCIRSNMSITNLFTVLLVSTPFLTKLSTNHGNFNNAFNIKIVFQRFIATLFSWRYERLDIDEERSLVRIENFKKTTPKH